MTASPTRLARATATAIDDPRVVASGAVASSTAPVQLSPGRLAALFLVPGALMTAAFVALAPLAESLALPPLAALLTAIVAVLVPFELGVVLWAGRGSGSPLGALMPRQPMARRTWSWLVPALIVVAFVGFGVSQPFEPQVIDGLFAWLPAWFVAPIAIDSVGDYATAVWVGVFVAFFVVNGLLGPIVEELYFRGYLLPRMAWLGRWAPLVNVSLFSLYHFWSPWQFVARILGFGPTVYAVQRKHNIVLGMVVHCSLNTLSVVLVAGQVFGRL